ncbi:MAG: helix-turn-helix domain-containing protein [Nanoarchaeota archaeon]|nr:helix-turn-helix domain-containing protein [Nanoarchaeota archaeon]
MKDQSLIQIILGDIAANEDYGLVMKKWRELFNITQSRIAKELKIKQSVISDYENNRRKSPGIEFIRKYTTGIVSIASKENKKEYESVIESLELNKESSKLLRGVFKKSMNNSQIIKLLKATQIISQENQSLFKDFVFFSDNLSKILTKQPSLKLIKSLKSNNEIVYIFSRVKSGKIPLITLKLLSKINKIDLPKLIIFQSDKFKISSLARRIAKNNNICIAVTKENNNTIRELLDVNAKNIIND